MKVFFVFRSLSIYIPLYPTWFRWKFSFSSKTPTFSHLYIPHGSDESDIEAIFEAIDTSFISHMVQMKGNASVHIRYDVTFLYIPHGSDERFKKIEITKTCEFFISHMVQMKEAILEVLFLSR